MRSQDRQMSSLTHRHALASLLRPGQALSARQTDAFGDGMGDLALLLPPAMGKRKSPASAQQVRKVFAANRGQLAQLNGKQGRTYNEPWDTNHRVSGEPITRLRLINKQFERYRNPFEFWPGPSSG